MDSTSPTPSAQNQETPMSNLITALIANFAENPMGYTDYRKHIEAMLKEHIKPIAVRSQRSIADNSWRSVQKAQFKGRGQQWIWVETQVVEPCLAAWEDEGEDVSVYRSLIEQNGKAWVRYAGPRLLDGDAMGAFEVRLSGSTIDHPKHLVYITAASLTEENLSRMEGTPHSLGLENMPEPEEETEAVEAEADDEALRALNEGLEAYAAEIETDDEATAS